MELTPYSETSTALREIIKVSISKQVPIGIIFGSKAILCTTRVDPASGDGLSDKDAFVRAIKNTGYKLQQVGQTYVFLAPDLTPHEAKIVSARFPKFSSSPVSMDGLGLWLNGYVLTLIDGSKGFAVNQVSRTDDEIVQLDPMLNRTPVEIASKIVSMKSKGLWILQTDHVDTAQSQDETKFHIYSFHDKQDAIRQISCPLEPPK